MIDGKPTVDLGREDIGRVIERARSHGLVLRVYEGQLHLSTSREAPPHEVVGQVRRNKQKITQAIELEQRLGVGWHRCEDNPANEDFWLQLHDAYCEICHEEARR